MKYKRIGHQKTYKPFEFVYEKIELTEDFPIDKPDEECIKELVDRIENMAKVAYPNLYNDTPVFVSPVNSVPWAGKVNGNSYASSSTELEPEQKPLLQLIQESKTVKELEGWKLLINLEKDKDKKRELLIAYESNMAGLQNQPA